MVPLFEVPQTIAELEDNSSDENIYRVHKSLKLDLNDVQSLKSVLEGVGSKVLRRGSIETFANDEVFVVFYSYVRSFPKLPSFIQSRLLDILEKSVRAACSMIKKDQEEGGDANEDLEIARVRSNVVKMSTFLLFTVISSAESAHVAGLTSEGPKKKGKKSSNDDEDRFNWGAYRESSVSAFESVLDADMSKLWNMGVPDEKFIDLFCRTGYQLLEQPIPGKGASGFKLLVLNLIAKPLRIVASLETAVVANMINLLNSHEHFAGTMALLCKAASTVSGDSRLATSVLREAAHVDLSSGGGGTGVKHTALFITELSAVFPSIVLQNLSILLPFLDAEPYLLRSSIVTAIVNVLVHATSEQQDDTQSDNEEGPSAHQSKESFTKTRESLLNILTERAHDVNSFTRGAVLKGWVVLCKEKSLPVLRVQGAALLAVDRLQDKTQIVRKAAMQLLTTLLEYNPFMGSLDPSIYENHTAELELWLQENPLPEDATTQKKEGDDDDENKENEDENNEDEDEEPEKVESEEIMVLRQTRALKVRELEIFMSASAFIQVLDKMGGPVLESMLNSKNSSDAIEAMRFFVQASHFNLPCASKGLRSSWSLAWSGEANVVTEVCKSFLLVHAHKPGAIEIGKKSDLLPPGKVAMNLINVVQAANSDERTSLEELFGNLVKDEGFERGVFAALRNGACEGKQASVRASAMLVLSMAANTDPSVLGGDKQLNALVEATLGSHQKGDVDWEQVRCACLALKTTSKAIVKKTEAAWEVKALEHCASVLRADWFDGSNDDIKRWFAASEQALSCVFAMSSAPEVLCAQVIKSHYLSVFGPDAAPCTAVRLACFCHLIGGVALSLLVYTESVAQTLKKVNSAKLNLKTAKAAEGEGSDNMEAELGLAAEADLEHDQRVNSIIDHQIIGSNLLAVYEPLLVRIVANEHGLFGDVVLREAACLALCKYMCISVEDCEKNLPLLFTTLASEKCASVRGNIMVALGDLAFRFPNAVEPWTSHIYRRLKDESGSVRSQTLMVLTHLILNDMVKVKGQVASMVLCLEDSCPRTADLAKLFFQELGKRGNSPIYNLMPDIVSLLSQDENVSRETFRSVIPFLMSFITKDKHSESLAEKLCHRFAACKDLAQIQDVAFCLAQLPINDKALKKLDSLIKTYRNHLFDEDVYASFTLLISKAKKFCKPEMKEALLEYANKLKSFHAGGDGVVVPIIEEEESEVNDEKEGEEAESSVLKEGDHMQEVNVQETEAEDKLPEKASRTSSRSSKSSTVKNKENAPAPRRVSTR